MALNKDGYSTPISKALIRKAITQKKDEASRKTMAAKGVDGEDEVEAIKCNKEAVVGEARGRRYGGQAGQRYKQ